MNFRNALSGMLVVLGLTLALPAPASNLPGQARLRGWLGFSTLSLDDINTQIRSERDAFMADTLVDESLWDPFGSAPNVGLELDVRLTPLLSAGLGYGTHRNSVRHEAFRIFSYDFDTGEPAEIEEFDETLKLSAWDVVGTLGLWVPSAPGLHFGAQLGLVRARLESHRVNVLSTYSAGEHTTTTIGEWTGSGVVLGAFTGYDQPLSSALSLSSRIGYRHRKINAPQGTLRILTLDENEGTSYEWETGPLLDAAGRRMSIDLGGFYFNMMLSLGFGRGD